MKEVEKIFNARDSTIIPLIPSVRNAIKIYFSAIRQSRLLKKNSRSGSRLERRCYHQASFDITRSTALENLAFLLFLENVLELSRPKLVIFTFEGHAWERLAISASKQRNHKIITVGYIHSSIYEAHHSITRWFGTNLEPTSVVTSNDLSTRILTANVKRTGQEIYTVGSVRELFGPLQAGSKNRGKVCLVLPEGIESEMERLFCITLSCALLCPEVQFIWRFHPLINGTNYLEKNKRFHNLPQNIYIAEGDLLSDLSEAKWAVYRGSSSIIQAVSAGVFPISLYIEGDDCIDPLHSLSLSSVVVSNATDLANFLRDNDSRFAKTLEELRFEISANFRNVSWNLMLDKSFPNIPI
jgi:hypothetical protein